ncbi:MAG: hypothetical protein A2V78_04815 [Betaproteobacteria bacterium RBG_16_64_18]|nr:MAG: hypothetical protein A2V78_04815 [Betaproteobacteria bacterium RBG_16_64_18]
MKSNVGGIDKILRIVAGLGLLSLLYFLEGNARWWGLIGLVPLATGLFNFCPLYTFIGINTGAPREEKKGA